MKSLLEPIEFDAESIHKPSEKFDFQNPQFDPIEFAKYLASKMIAEKGIGLAAPQLGFNIQAIAIQSNPVIVMYNPRIVDYSSEEVVLEEGDISYPGLFIEKIRPRKIKVRYTEPNGNVVTAKYTDLTSRIIQHCMDYTQGKRYFDNISPLKLQIAIKRAKKKFGILYRLDGRGGVRKI